jgi:hypothetical protein
MLLLTGQFLPSIAFCDALYFQERVINQAQAVPPTRPPFPSEKISSYSNPVGLPIACNIARKYPAAPQNIAQRCDPNSSSYDPPSMQQALYPVETVTGALFSLPEDHGPDGLGHLVYWNLLGSQAQPGFVYIDPARHRYVQFAYLSKNVVDDSSVGSYVVNDLKLYYRVSLNDGASFDTPGGLFRPVIQTGPGYDVLHPFAPVYVNRNGVALPGTANIISSFNGDILVPLLITPLDQSDIDYTKVTSYTDDYVLRGTWNSSGTDLTWKLGEIAHIPSTISTRGADEPAILELDATGRCIMVARGSNQFGSSNESNENIAGHYWLFQSNDGCRTWNSGPTRWGYNDGTPFFSPAANSILFRSPQNSRVYWIGLISASNSHGNWPRTTLVAAEVDLQNLGVIKDSVTVVDEMGWVAGDTDLLQLNNEQIAVQPNGSAFVYWPRQDFGRSQSDQATSWYQIAQSTSNTALLSVSVDGSNLSHGLSWSSSRHDVEQWHVRRRYSSGDPLADLWTEVGALPGASVGTTISGYLPWQEAEYEVVAQHSDGTAEVSNRTIARFPAWQGPRLSFFFPTETAAGDLVPKQTVGLRWTYEGSATLSGFRLFRRYYTDGTPGAWAAVGDLSASQRGTTLSGYLPTDQFDLYLQPLSSPPAAISNVANIRFPAPGGLLPY